MPYASLQKVNDVGNPQSEAAIEDSITTTATTCWSHRKLVGQSHGHYWPKAYPNTWSNLTLVLTYVSFLTKGHESYFKSLSCNWRYYFAEGNLWHKRVGTSEWMLLTSDCFVFLLLEVPLTRLWSSVMSMIDGEFVLAILQLCSILSYLAQNALILSLSLFGFISKLIDVCKDDHI